MRKIIKRLSVLLVALGMAVITIGANPVAAQQTGTNANGIKISPVRTDLVVKPGESKTVVIIVQNITKAEATFDAIINDFVAGDNENGQPALVLDADKYAPSHSLKRYISTIPSVTIPANDSKDVKVTINIPKSAAGGGYYGAVRFAPAGTVDSTKNINMIASVGSLILVKVPGDVQENLTLESFDVRSSKDALNGSSFFTSNKNLFAVGRFRNAGNVHEQPFGKVVLKKGDKVLETVEINSSDPRGNVLPDSVRRFSAPLTKVGIWGKYTVEGNFGYGSNGQLLSGKTSFFVFPLLYIILGAVLIGIVVFLIFGLPKLIKRYNQSVVRKANRRR